MAPVRVAPGSRFAVPVVRVLLTPQQLEDAAMDGLSVRLREYSRAVGIPDPEINAKVSELVARVRAEMQLVFPSS